MESEVATVLEAVPDFVPRYLDLAEAADEEPGAAETLTELADYVAELVGELEHYRPALARCLDAIEAMAGVSSDTDELIEGAFLDSLSPDDVVTLSPLFGPHTLSLLEDLHGGDL
jgi:hypothetical protein